MMVDEEILNKNFVYTLSLVSYLKYSELHRSPAIDAFGFMIFYKNYFDLVMNMSILGCCHSVLLCR